MYNFVTLLQKLKLRYGHSLHVAETDTKSSESVKEGCKVRKKILLKSAFEANNFSGIAGILRMLNIWKGVGSCWLIFTFR